MIAGFAFLIVDPGSVKFGSRQFKAQDIFTRTKSSWLSLIQAAGTDDQPNNQNDYNDNSDDDLAVDNNGALDDADTFSPESPGNDSIEDVTSEKWDDENAIEAEDDCDEAEDGCRENKDDETEDVCGEDQVDETEDGC